ncbi:MAG: flagellar export protein FliJ [Deltaproteobacteria bacterium]|nr:flagellar export protein FliJ [Deltaproteobacteria bacterium]
MFRFDLEAVLNFRVQIEEQCQLEFSDALNRLQAARVVLEDLKKEKKDRIVQLTKIQENAVNSDVIQRHFAFIEYLKCKEEKQRAVICKMEEEAEAKRHALLEAVKKRKVMETLREKKKAEYLLEMATKARKELDDFTIIKFAHGLRK